MASTRFGSTGTTVTSGTSETTTYYDSGGGGGAWAQTVLTATAGGAITFTSTELTGKLVQIEGLPDATNSAAGYVGTITKASLGGTIGTLVPNGATGAVLMYLTVPVQCHASRLTFTLTGLTGSKTYTLRYVLE